MSKIAAEDAISADEAEKLFGMKAKFGVMPTNGEKRFRLLNLRNDTSYICTVTDEGSSGWQNSHYHKSLMETYIVQEGWIGYAELVGARPLVLIYSVGELFTTKPNIVHNIYMPASTTIHTVKHGTSVRQSERNSDWWDDTVQVKELNRFVRVELKDARDVLQNAKK